MTRILIVDDHPLFREALRDTILQSLPNAEFHEASTLDEAQRTIRAVGRITLAILDLRIPNTRGFVGLLTLRKNYPSLPVVVVSAFDDARFVREALNYGAVGFIPKSLGRHQICQALHEILNGNLYVPPSFDRAEIDKDDVEREDLAKRLRSLTRQQLAVMRRLRDGQSNKQIAAGLGIIETTVKSHVSEVLRKLNVASRTQVAIAIRKIDFDIIIQEIESANGQDNSTSSASC